MISDSTRRNDILDAVVRLNVETGRPISSGLVERFLSRAYSSATIRNVMQDLERDGLLVQPHTSAGRLPTDAGFRLFVDRLLATWSVRRRETPREIRRKVESDLRDCIGSHGMVKMLAQLLSELTANISIILGPSRDNVQARRLELYPKESGRILLVLVLENALVRTGIVTPQREYRREVIQEAERLLCERINGRSVAELRQVLPASLRLSASPAGDCAADLFERGQEIFADLEEGEIRLEGVARVLDEPEFSEPGALKNLIRFIESPRTIREALLQLDREASSPLSVWIGCENPVGDLRSFGLVSCRFDLDDQQGILAVLGPRRMPYQQALAGIDVLRRSLTRVS